MTTENTTAIAPEATDATDATAETNGTETKTKRRGRQAKPAHPLLLDETGERTNQLDAVPEDYSLEVYSRLNEDDFSDPVVYWGWKKSILEDEISHCDQQIELCQTFDSDEKRKNVQKFFKLSSQIEELAKSLQSGDEAVDLDKIKELMGM